MAIKKITEKSIGTGAVTENKLGPAAVTQGKIGASAVNSAKIEDSTIVNADIAPSAAIASTKLTVDTSTLENNIALLGFKMAVNEGLTVFNLVDGIVDEFHDESGIDTGENANQTYCGTSDFYSNSSAACAPATEELTSFGNPALPQGTVTGTFTADPAATHYNVLIQAGGGGSGSDAGGGGGAGGQVFLANYPVTGGSTYSIISGAGGFGSNQGSQNEGDDGSNSEFNEIIALGGGAGGGRTPGSERCGNPGGSGGGQTEGGGGSGAPAGGQQPGQPGLAGSSGFGNPGGTSPGGSHGAGGGGANGGGQPAPGSDGGGDGGGGKDYTIVDGSTPLEYGAGGGGGGSGTSEVGVAGGPSGGQGRSEPQGFDPAQNAVGLRGGGAGGLGNTGPSHGGNGGPGIVALQMSKKTAVSATATLTSAPFGVADSSAPTTSRIVIFAEIGGEVLNTDVIASVSRNNGANYTNITLADSGYVAGTSGQKIFTGSVDISGQPSGNNMRYKVTQANLSSQVKIHGVALQWS